MAVQILRHPKTAPPSVQLCTMAVHYTARVVTVTGSCHTREDLQSVIDVLMAIRKFLPSKQDDFPDGMWNVGQW